VKTKRELIYAKECYRIIGICFEVYNEIGYSHKEKFYQEAIAKCFIDKRFSLNFYNIKKSRERDQKAKFEAEPKKTQ